MNSKRCENFRIVVIRATGDSSQMALQLPAELCLQSWLEVRAIDGDPFNMDPTSTAEFGPAITDEIE